MGKKSGQEPDTKKKWNWLGPTLRRNDDSITKQALWWTPQAQGHKGKPRNNWNRDLEKEMWTAGYKHSWRKKMEAAKQDRAGWRQLQTSGLWLNVLPRVTRLQSSKSSHRVVALEALQY